VTFNPASSTMVIMASQRPPRPAGDGAGARDIRGYAQWLEDLALGSSRKKGEEGWRGGQQWRLCKGLGLPHGSNEPHATAVLKPIPFPLSVWRLAVKTDKRRTPA
jgi:hypothetical protein